LTQQKQILIISSHPMLVKLSNVFGVSLDQLVKDEQFSQSDLDKVKVQEFVKRIDHINNLPDEEQKALLMMIDAFVKKQQMEDLLKK